MVLVTRNSGPTKTKLLSYKNRKRGGKKVKGGEVVKEGENVNEEEEMKNGENVKVIGKMKDVA